MKILFTLETTKWITRYMMWQLNSTLLKKFKWLVTQFYSFGTKTKSIRTEIILKQAYSFALSLNQKRQTTYKKIALEQKCCSEMKGESSLGVKIKLHEKFWKNSSARSRL